MRAPLFALLLLLLTACGGGRDIFASPGGPTAIHVRVVSSLPNGWGARYQRDGTSGVIEVLSSLLGSHDTLVRTLVHELGHSMGLEHGADPACVMFETNAGGSTWSICPQEVAGASGANAATVDAEGPLDEATFEAVQRWNTALVRTQFTYVP